VTDRRTTRIWYIVASVGLACGNSCSATVACRADELHTAGRRMQGSVIPSHDHHHRATDDRRGTRDGHRQPQGRASGGGAKLGPTSRGATETLDPTVSQLDLALGELASWRVDPSRTVTELAAAK
jgi:hypothetical protein